MLHPLELGLLQGFGSGAALFSDSEARKKVTTGPNLARPTAITDQVGGCSLVLVGKDSEMHKVTKLDWIYAIRQWSL
ncbi:hypothetical protein ZWY2020_012568 [Hordeum vulgare]|nr:hypothetical protein ZWY2020_012568 [Hordeum vulgare]